MGFTEIQEENIMKIQRLKRKTRFMFLFTVIVGVYMFYFLYGSFHSIVVGVLGFIMIMLTWCLKVSKYKKSDISLFDMVWKQLTQSNLNEDQMNYLIDKVYRFEYGSLKELCKSCRVALATRNFRSDVLQYIENKQTLDNHSDRLAYFYYCIYNDQIPKAVPTEILVFSLENNTSTNYSADLIRGLYYMANKDYEKALSLFEDVLTRELKTGDIKAIVRYYEAKTLVELNREAEAIDILEELIISSKPYGTYDYAVTLYRKLGGEHNERMD